MGKFSRLGNDLYNGDKSINFVTRVWRWYAISAAIVILALVGLFGRGINLGIEFEGGTEYKITLPSNQVTQANVDRVKAAVADSGLDNASAPIVNTSGDQAITVQTEVLTENQSNQVIRIIEDTLNVGDDAVSPTEVGPSWGAQVAQQAITGLVVFLFLVVLFIWAYFREWKMSVAAIVALAHDVLITVGIYALSGFEVTPATVTGLLTILGFSLYDTVVVFDKVRENTKNLKSSRMTYAEAANLAVNQTLVRSINTSIVALLPVAAILYVGVTTLGSGALKDLSLSLFIGMAAGAYSSIFIATPLLVQMKSREKDVTDADARARARAKRDADRYASVPVFYEGMAVEEEPRELAPVEGSEAPARSPGETQPTPVDRPHRRANTEAMGLGRTVPESKGPVGESGSAKRNQPARQPRSKRGKK